MSVLFKALQKAEKENEERQADPAGESFDPQRLAGSGAIHVARGRALNWRVGGITAAVVLAVAIGAAFFLFQPSPSPQIASTAPAPTAPVLQPPRASNVAPSPDLASSDVAAEPAAGVAETEMAAAPSAEAPSAEDSTPQEAQAVAVEERASLAEPEPQMAPAPAPPAPSQAAAREPMPQLAADSLARMLSPPISINRGGFALAGVGDAVQVRQVSQQAQDNAGAGYSALIRGEYDTALAFYDQALEQEPRSALALLGRGAALQKLGRLYEAQSAYDAVLRLDPKNREAMTNLTAIVSERAPNEALARLINLEHEHPNFSPVTAQIGLTYAKMGSMPQARDYLRRAVALTPEAVMYHYNLALVLDHMDLGDQAIRSYENVLAATAGGSGAIGLSPVDIERRVHYLRNR